MPSTLSIPVIDISDLVDDTPDKQRVAQLIGDACREYGFFYITGHGVDETLQTRLETLSRQFFDQPLEEKKKCQVSPKEKVVHGYYPIGSVSVNANDVKEHLSFGDKFDENDARLDCNLYPDIPLYRETTVEYIKAMKQLARQLMAGIALSLGLDENYFHEAYTKEAEIAFRNIHYPESAAVAGEDDSCWGIGEHTDYGLLTILKQDDCGGLQVRSTSGWIEATPIEGTFVCNLGDMLERATGGLYLSTPHRVTRPRASRMSFPFFLAPNFNSVVKPIDEIVARNGVRDNKNERYDKSSVFDVNCTFGEYLLSKLSKPNSPEPEK